MISTSLLHPMVVHFPIALIILGFLADISSLLFRKEVCLSRFGFYLLISGTLAAMAAVLTGLLFTSEMSGTAGDIKETHELFALITLGTLIACSIFRIVLKIKGKENTDLKWMIFLLYGLAAISVSITGYYGGTLVYG